MNASFEPKEAVGQSTWKAVVLYSEVESGKDAARLLQQVAARAGDPASCDSSLWRFDILKHPEVAREALYEARDAHLVLLAARGVDRPPTWLVEWLEMWAMTRREREAVLAAFCRTPHTPELMQAVGGLRRLAETHRLEFIYAEESRGRAARGASGRGARRTT